MNAPEKDAINVRVQGPHIHNQSLSRRLLRYGRITSTMQSFTELTPPTAVTHSLSLPFLSPSANNLVVAKTSLLQIFSLKSVLTDSANSSDLLIESRRASGTGVGSSLPSAGPVQRGDKTASTKLVLVAQYELAGTITSLSRIKIMGSKSGGNALLVSLRNAKVSLVEWDPERYSISTVSIHLYEQEDIRGNPWEADLDDHINYLSVDPRSRCAALKFGARHLAIIPFHQVGDDIVMDDYDSEIDGERPEPIRAITKAEGDKKEVGNETPYGASFVLSMLALDPGLSHPLHLAFLNEYREPTFGILSAQIGSSNALLHERRDNLSYTVITIDLEQRASTALLSVSDLPYDLFAVIPLRLPIGGALLVGGNELIHVDQAGKTNGVAVNEFAKNSTSFTLGDQSDLGLRLEGCVIEQLGLESSEMLIIMNTGELAILGFKIDGRSISGVSVRRVMEVNGGLALSAGPSCASVVGRGRMFVGSEDADSVVLGWSRRLEKLKRQRSRVEMDIDDDIETSDLDIDDDDDDLYSGAKAEKAPEQVTSTTTPDQNDDYRFKVHDILENFGPMKSIALRRLDKEPDIESNSNPSAHLELLTTGGRGVAGGLTIFRREIEPHVLEKYELPNSQEIWSISVTSGTNGLGSIQPDDYDNYIIVSSVSEDEEPRSLAYSVTSNGLQEVKDTDFDPAAGGSIEVGTLNSGTRIVQVLSSELRAFDAGELFSLHSPQSGRLGDCSLWTNLGMVSASRYPKEVRMTWMTTQFGVYPTTLIYPYPITRQYPICIQLSDSTNKIWSTTRPVP